MIIILKVKILLHFHLPKTLKCIEIKKRRAFIISQAIHNKTHNIIEHLRLNYFVILETFKLYSSWIKYYCSK